MGQSPERINSEHQGKGGTEAENVKRTRRKTDERIVLKVRECASILSVGQTPQAVSAVPPIHSIMWSDVQ